MRKFIFLYLLFITGTVHATVVLDFDSVAGGSNIVANSLVTVDGTISVNSTNGNLRVLEGFYLNTDTLTHQQSADTDYAQLVFDYDVESILFDFDGRGRGDFFAVVLDSALSIVDTFRAATNTNNGFNISLSGDNIRYLRFSDTPSANTWSGIDNVRITAASVPEPSAIALMGLGLLGFVATRRKRQK